MTEKEIAALRSIALKCSDHTTTDALDRLIAKAERALSAPAAPEPTEAENERQTLAMMLRKCEHALKIRGREDLAADVIGLLRRYDLLGSPLRAAPAAPSVPADLRQCALWVVDAYNSRRPDYLLRTIQKLTRALAAAPQPGAPTPTAKD